MQHDAPIDPHATKDGSPPAVHGDAHEPNHMREYVRTIITLSVLTIVEFALSFWMVGKSRELFTFGIVLLVVLAFVKATMVARFFMHLKYDPRFLGFLVLTPVILAAPLIFLAGYDVVHGPHW